MADRAPRILLVDDEQPIQTLLSFPLQRDGYEVVQASDGREALARFAEQTFDLVVLDVMLPRMDGLEVCRRLRADGSTVPIIMLTAKSEEIDKVLGLELGADDYITKPFSMREFRSRVKAALRRAGMARAGGRRRAADRGRAACASTRPSARSTRDGDARRRPRSSSSRSSPRSRAQPGPRVHARHAARARVGRLRLPRPAHDRRPHPPPAREDRGRRQGAGVPVHGARRRLPLPGRRGVDHACPACGRCATGWRSIFALIVARRDRDDLPLRHAAARGAAARRRSSSGLPTDARALRRAAAPARRRDDVRDAEQPLREDRARARRAPASSAEVLIARPASTSRPARSRGQLDSAPDGGVDRATTCTSRRRATPSPRGRPVAATEPTAVGRQALAAEPLIEGDEVARRRGVRRLARRREANVALIRRQILLSGGDRARARAARRLPRGARAVAARQAARAAPRARSRRATSRTRSAPTPTTSSASSRPRSTTCRASSRGSTARASSSSPPPRTSCARRSSRSAASSSCSRTRSSTRRRGASSSTSCAGRSTACASSPPSCSTSRGWSPARSSCGRSRPTSASSRARSPASSRRRRSAHESASELELPERADRARVRPRAGRPGAADPARQRARPHAAGHRRRGFGRARERARPPGGLRPRPRDQAPEHAPHLRALLHLQRARRRAPASAWRSRASSPSACTAR